jgi:elongator complex protein 3
LGTRLINRAAEIAQANGCQRLAVIAAIGTRKYYQSRGFSRAQYYMIKNLKKASEE